MRRLEKWMACCVLLLTVGCAVVAQDGTTAARTITVGELNRTYNLNIPKNLPKDNPLPWS